MNIKSITLKHTNPSLGPHETITTVSITASEEHLARINTFLQNSTINNTVTLYEYLEAVQTNNSKLIEKVLGNAPNNPMNEGETISNLSFYFDHNQTIELSDVYRRFLLTQFYPEFTAYMVEKGTISRENANFDSPIIEEIKPLQHEKYNSEHDQGNQ